MFSFIEFTQKGLFHTRAAQEGWSEPRRKLETVHPTISDVFLEVSKNSTKENVPHC